MAISSSSDMRHIQVKSTVLFPTSSIPGERRSAHPCALATHRDVGSVAVGRMPRTTGIHSTADPVAVLPPPSMESSIPGDKKSPVRNGASLNRCVPRLGRWRLPRESGSMRMASARHDARRLPALGSLGMLELDVLPFVKRLIPIRLNGGKMHEYILATVRRDDKTVSLGVGTILQYQIAYSLLAPLFLCTGASGMLRFGDANILREPNFQNNAVETVSCTCMAQDS